jgi:hypothetical protein
VWLRPDCCTGLDQTAIPNGSDSASDGLDERAAVVDFRPSADVEVFCPVTILFAGIVLRFIPITALCDEIMDYTRDDNPETKCSNASENV